MPIFEPGLDQLVERNVRGGRLAFTTDLAAGVADADAVFIAVGTPSRRGDGHADLSYVFGATEEIARALKKPAVVVTKSTVPVGTGDEVERIIRETNHIRAFDVLPNGLLAKQTDRVFADLRGSEPGVADGMKVDTAGNVYCGGAGGLWILDPTGKKLGRIVHGQPATTNLGFGGNDWKTLYFTTRTHLGAINVKIPGIEVPTQKK
jgi:hypothetical protein